MAHLHLLFDLGAQRRVLQRIEIEEGKVLEIATDLRTLLPERDLNEAIRYEAIALDGMERSAEAEERYYAMLDEQRMAA